LYLPKKVELSTSTMHLACPPGLVAPLQAKEAAIPCTSSYPLKLPPGLEEELRSEVAFCPPFSMEAEEFIMGKCVSRTAALGLEVAVAKDAASQRLMQLSEMPHKEEKLCDRALGAKGRSKRGQGLQSKQKHHTKLGKENSTAEEPASEDGVCATCAHSIAKQAKFCTFCGAKCN